ncbi:MAG: hypothetical protein IKM20_10870, partial [Erysipelotrichales bacterium]|nr:hypothetical protein [Erysipelotrichales bacterium]
VLEPTNLLENKGKEFNAFSGEVWTNIEDSKNVYYIINGDLYSEDNLNKSLYVFEEGRIELD